MPTSPSDKLTRGSRRYSLKQLDSPYLYHILIGVIDTSVSEPYQYTSAIRIGSDTYISGLNGVYNLDTDTGDYINIGATNYGTGYKTLSGDGVNLGISTTNLFNYGYDWGSDEIYNQYTYVFGGSPGTINFSGLDIGTYDFAYWCIGPSYVPEQEVAVTMAGVTKNGIAANNVPGIYVENSDYVRFNGIQITGSSQIITATIATYAGASYGPVNGIQISKTS